MKNRYLIIFFILTSCLQGFAQSGVIDSLRNILKTEKDDTNKVHTLNTISKKLIKIGKYDSAMKYGTAALAIANTAGFKKGIAEALNNIGTTYCDQDNYLQAVEYAFKALAINKEIGNKNGMADNLNNIGNTYFYQGNYPQALEYYFQALAIHQEINNREGVANSLGNIGIVYSQQENYPMALEYCTKAMTMYQKIGDKLHISTNLSNIGAVYYESGNHQKALEYFLKALAINQEIGNKDGIARSMGNIGIIYKNQGDYPVALEYYFKALTLKRELGDKNGIAINLGNIGSVYINQKKYKQAQEYLDSALTLSKKIGEKEITKDFYSELAALDSATGDYKKGWGNYKNFMLYKDSMVNEATIKKTTQAEMNYKFDRKTDSTKAEQDKLNLIAAKESQKQKIILYSFIGGFSLTLALALLIFIGYKQKQQANKIITRQKELVEEKNREILDSISYAKRLQDAILPPLSIIKQFFPESFVLYKPKDIVAGDFYWMEQTGDIILIAAADCTGHGVPGALVSVVCSNALNRTVKEFHITEPGKILDKVRELVLETFAKSQSNVQDGMDISLCCIHTKTKEVQWSGAYNPLWYIQNGKIYEIAADKQPIGKNDKPQPFNTHILKLKKGDTLYLFTDGYADQFGGTKGKKFKYKQMEKLLLANATKPMEEQKNILESTLEEWKASLEQVDDILIIGIRV